MAIKANLFVDQGSDFSATVSLVDASGNALDLTDYTANAQMRKNYASSSATTFTATVNTPKTLGVLTLSLTNAQTSALEPGRYLYDVEIVSNTNVITRVVEGIVTVTPNITRV
jgi:hypothetical protein